jgi:hypothetical protein
VHKHATALHSGVASAILRPSARLRASPLPRSVTPPEAPELVELQSIVDTCSAQVAHRVVDEVQCGGRRLPIHLFTLGNADPQMPAVGFFAGVHGLERIGTQVLIAHLRSLLERLQWDDVLQRQLEHVRLVFMPVVNPGGLWRGTRANPNGVDLMRNAPVDALERVPWLVGGQRLSAGLPWYRGPRDEPMQVESRALCEVVAGELLARRFSIALDCHSGFGSADRIWFPYAHSRQPIAHLPEMHALDRIFARSHAHHRYVVEPQSQQYLAHGDLWDHLYQRALQTPAHTFLPLTLEMGSWLWVRKNPRQLFSRHGMFNPANGHRRQRVLRQHLPWLDFLARAAGSHRQWLPDGAAREAHRQQALQRWYGAAT